VKIRWLAGALLLLTPATAAAEWQFKPFLGATFGGSTTFVDLEHAVGSPHATVGLTALLVGETFGVEGDVGETPGFFESGNQHLVVRSHALTLTGNVVIAMPRRLTQYTLRPYFVGGAGLMHVRSEDFFSVVPLSSTRPAMDLGGGATGFLTDRFGVNWDVRFFRSLGGQDGGGGVSFGPEQLSFWRASMALAIKY
jgi:hypothetical protein